MHEDADRVGNGTISCDDVQGFDDGLVGESQESKLQELESQDVESQEQRAAKKMRLTPPVEGEKCVA